MDSRQGLTRRELLTFLRRDGRPEPPRAPSAPPPRAAVTMKIRANHCLAWTGSFCSVCAERCPVPGAVRPTPEGRPVIDESRCTGCGECVAVCPAPVHAIELTAREERRTSP